MIQYIFKIKGNECIDFLYMLYDLIGLLSLF